MKYLLDTCIISEMIKKKPNQKVIQWINKQKIENLYISVITLAEIKKGIEKLKDDEKKS